MTDDPPRPLVDPCPPDEPLVWRELNQHCATLRVLLAVLAETRAVVTLPENGWLPELAPLSIASGWMLRPDLTLDRETGRMLLSCEHVRWWPGAPKPDPAAGGQ